MYISLHDILIMSTYECYSLPLKANAFEHTVLDPICVNDYTFLQYHNVWFL
jgi:hypothetical protein